MLTVLLAASILVLGQTADPPSIEEVFRQFPPDPHALDFVQTALFSFIPGFGAAASDPVPGPIFKVGGTVTAPRATKTFDPEYSREARTERVMGTVVLFLVIGPDGVPRNIKVARSLGHGLDEKAIEAVRKWRFQPATKDGKPVAVQVNVEVNFRR